MASRNASVVPSGSLTGRTRLTVRLAGQLELPQRDGIVRLCDVETLKSQ
jgi:hypothetical protein